MLRRRPTSDPELSASEAPHRAEALPERAVTFSRRTFLQGSVGAALLGCGESPTVAVDDASTDAPDDASRCADPFAGAALLGLAPFVSQREGPLAEPFGAGLDGRLITDLTTLTDDALETPTARFYVRTRASSLLDLRDRDAVRGAWRVALGGDVDAPRDVPLAEILAQSAPLGATVMECSGNAAAADFGLMSAARWAGVPLARVVATARPRASATRVLVSGFDRYATTSARSRPGASWVFSRDELGDDGPWLVTAMNGEALPDDHGFPLRLIVPGWYGCASIKWVDAVQLVADDVAATDHMQEFASRTGQEGVPTLAREYRPAVMDPAAMPVRVERWRVGGRVVHRVVGVAWGGARPVDALEISFDGGIRYERVTGCVARTSSRSWGLWTHAWRPTETGRYIVRLRVPDRAVTQRRLDAGYYARTVEITSV